MLTSFTKKPLLKKLGDIILGSFVGEIIGILIAIVLSVSLPWSSTENYYIDNSTTIIIHTVPASNRVHHINSGGQTESKGW